MGTEGFEPPTKLLCIPLLLSQPHKEFVVWTLSLSVLDISRQVSTPSLIRAWLGIAILKVSPNLREFI